MSTSASNTLSNMYYNAGNPILSSGNNPYTNYTTTATNTIASTAGVIYNYYPIPEPAPIDTLDHALDHFDLSEDEKIERLLARGQQELHKHRNSLNKLLKSISVIEEDVKDLKKKRLENLKNRHRKHKKYDTYSPVTLKRVEKCEGIDQLMGVLRDAFPNEQNSIFYTFSIGGGGTSGCSQITIHPGTYTFQQPLTISLTGSGGCGSYSSGNSVNTVASTNTTTTAVVNTNALANTVVLNTI